MKLTQHHEEDKTMIQGVGEQMISTIKTLDTKLSNYHEEDVRYFNDAKKQLTEIDRKVENVANHVTSGFLTLGISMDRIQAHVTR